MTEDGLIIWMWCWGFLLYIAPSVAKHKRLVPSILSYALLWPVAVPAGLLIALIELIME